MLNETVKRLWPLVLSGEITRADLGNRLNISPQRVSVVAKQQGLEALHWGWPRGKPRGKRVTTGENDGTRTPTEGPRGAAD